jgi:hypothetical protein
MAERDRNAATGAAARVVQDANTGGFKIKIPTVEQPDRAPAPAPAPVPAPVPAPAPAAGGKRPAPLGDANKPPGKRAAPPPGEVIDLCDSD